MTALISENDLDTYLLDEVDWSIPPMCEAEYSDGSPCENEADYVCAISCCGGMVLLCEDCLFEFIDYCRHFEGVRFQCTFCGRPIVLHPKHLKVTGRV